MKFTFKTEKSTGRYRSFYFFLMKEKKNMKKIKNH